MSKKNKQQVPKIRFEGFSENWKDKIIGDVADIKRGASPRPISDPKWFDNDSVIGWVRISDVTRSFRILEKTEQYLSEKGVQKSRLIKSGSIIMSICATIGKPVYTAFDVCIHDGFVVFDDLKIDADYTLYFLQTIQDKWYQYGQPGTQVNLNSDIVSNENIKYPSLKEQTQIGNFFQQLDKLIELQTRAVESAETYKKAMLQKMFPQKGEKVPRVRFAGFSGDWDNQKLGNCTKLITKGTTPKVNDNIGEINFIKVENLNNGEINPTHKTSKFEHEHYLKRSQLEDGDILFSIAGTLGRTAIVSKRILPANTNQALSIIRGYNFDTYFLVTTLSGNIVEEYVRKNPTVGAQPNLSLEQVRSLEIFAPKLSEQTKIGNYFQKLDYNIEAEKKKLGQYQNMKKAMLQRMFV